MPFRKYVDVRGADVKRPIDLPEFANPPLNEVVLGVQFDPPVGYQQIRAGEVWRLYSENFPNVQELPPLSPSFETFGPQGLPQLNLGIVTGASHDRFWFVSPDGDQLIQFQNDRLLHNWRKMDSNSNFYPRFEGIFESFSGELSALNEYMSSLAPDRSDLRIRQCEISYINHIYPQGDQPSGVSSWLDFIKFAEDPSDFSCSFRSVIQSAEGKPVGRLICEAASAFGPRGAFIALTLTVRGMPSATSVESALEFLTTGRDIIVRRFAKITTDSAQLAWGRMQ